LLSRPALKKIPAAHGLRATVPSLGLGGSKRISSLLKRHHERGVDRAGDKVIALILFFLNLLFRDAPKLGWLGQVRR
jgi:hypothetical protein